MAQAIIKGGLMFMLLLLLGVVIAVVFFLIGSRGSRPPAAASAQRAPEPGFGAQYDPRFGPQPPRSGMGGHIMGGLATGLAVGAGAAAAQEIGRHVLGDHSQHGSATAADFHPASDSRLAHDAGIDSVDAGPWDDAGAFDAGGDGGWDN